MLDGVCTGQHTSWWVAVHLTLRAHHPASQTKHVQQVWRHSAAPCLMCKVDAPAALAAPVPLLHALQLQLLGLPVYLVATVAPVSQMAHSVAARPCPAELGLSV